MGERTMTGYIVEIAFPNRVVIEIDVAQPSTFTIGDVWMNTRVVITDAPPTEGERT